MADILSKERRSENMAAVKHKDTKPEIIVRKFLHNQGFRFRLHRKDLAGCPDIVMKKWNAAVFVNGCFWHRHPHCKLAYAPKSNLDFWCKKFDATVQRDTNNYQTLIDQGWNVIIVWECDIRNNSFQKKLIREVRHLDGIQRLDN